MTEGRPADRHLLGDRAAAPMLPGRSGPLTDIKVIDLTRALSGPYTTMMLADMGADVIKVEGLSGDLSRFGGPFTKCDQERAYGGYFGSINRNKRGIVLDLASDEDRGVLLELIIDADVLVENFRPGVMERFNLGYEVLRERNPRLVYGAIRGFGDPRTGESPYSDWPAFDIVAQAMSGVMSYTGQPGGDPVAVGPSIGDLYPATMLTAGVLGALHHATVTGEGQFVEVSMVDALIALCEGIVWRYSYTGSIQEARGTDHVALCPFGLYSTADGSCAIAAPTAKHWRLLCDVIGRPDLVDDPRTSDNRDRIKNRELVRAAIEGWSRELSRDDVVAALAGVVPVGPVQDAADLFEDPHVRARDMLVAVDHAGSGRKVVFPNTPLRFTATPAGVYRRAPRLNEHGDDIRAAIRDRPRDATAEPGGETTSQ